MDELQRLSPKTYHAKTAAARIVRDYPEFADPIIIDAVRWHTTGHAGMTLTEQVCAQAALLAGQLTQEQNRILDALCTAATVSLTARLREGLTPEDCKADFVAAASLYALAALHEAKDTDRIAQFPAGDVTIRTGSGDAASNCLRYQAELIITPYLKDRFAFREV